MNLTEQAREIFSHDIYASETTGIVIDHAEKDHAICSFEIGPHHLNANNVVMGGAVFTLADVTFAVAANTDNPSTVTLTSQITFMASAKGKKLIAEAHCLRSGRSTAVFLIDVTDDLGTKVASVSTTGIRTG